MRAFRVSLAGGYYIAITHAGAGRWLVLKTESALYKERREMERKTANDYPQELLNLFDTYVHGGIDRRQFLEGAQKFAVGGVTATAIWESLRPNYAWAQQVPKDVSRIKTEVVTVESPMGNTNIK